MGSLVWEPETGIAGRLAHSTRSGPYFASGFFFGEAFWDSWPACRRCPPIAAAKDAVRPRATWPVHLGGVRLLKSGSCSHCVSCCPIVGPAFLGPFSRKRRPGQQVGPSASREPDAEAGLRSVSSSLGRVLALAAAGQGGGAGGVVAVAAVRRRRPEWARRRTPRRTNARRRRAPCRESLAEVGRAPRRSDGHSSGRSLPSRRPAGRLQPRQPLGLAQASLGDGPDSSRRASRYSAIASSNSGPGRRKPR